MKKVYEAPKAEAVEVKADDIIRTSDGVAALSLRNDSDFGDGDDVGNE